MIPVEPAFEAGSSEARPEVLVMVLVDEIGVHVYHVICRRAIIEVISPPGTPGPPKRAGSPNKKTQTRVNPVPH